MAKTALPAAFGTHGQPGDREAAAGYIAEMAGDLAFMARAQGFDTLGYILEMAALEAGNAVPKRNR